MANKYFMKIKAFFDASYYPVSKRGIIAIVIKDIDSNMVLKKSAWLIKSTSSTHAELMALFKLVKYLNNKQANGLIPMNTEIHVFGDNVSVINFANFALKYNGLSERDAHEFNIAYEALKANNEVILIWVNSKNNTAHITLTNFKKMMKALNQKWFFYKR